MEFPAFVFYATILLSLIASFSILFLSVRVKAIEKDLALERALQSARIVKVELVKK